MCEMQPESFHGINPEVGTLLKTIIADKRPSVTLEVGLALGVSTLLICEELRKVGGHRHIAIDPGQTTEFKAIGIGRVRNAGFEDLVELREQESQFALPQLVAEGVQVDFAFVDGAHTLDHTLVDFFFIDRLLRVGGVVSFDDCTFPQIHHICRFIATNRAYRTYGASSGSSPRLRNRVIQWLARRSVNVRRTVQARFIVTDEQLNFPRKARCLAFEKLAEDTRDLNYSHEDF